MRAIRVRGLIILVAVVALGLGSFETVRRFRARTQHYRAIAEQHLNSAYGLRQKATETAMRAQSELERRNLMPSVEQAEATLRRARKLGGVLTARSREFEARTRQFEEVIKRQRLRAEQKPRPGYDFDSLKGRAEQYKKLAEYHEQMQAKYEDAAAHPWRNVSPDPPAPPDPLEQSAAPADDQSTAEADQ